MLLNQVNGRLAALPGATVQGILKLGFASSRTPKDHQDNIANVAWTTK